MLTHNDRDCTSRSRSRGPQSVGDKQFGSWLRALTPHPSKKSVMHVEGYEKAREAGASRGGNVTEHGSVMNGGATMRDGAGSEDEQQSNHGNNLERRVDQEDFFQEGPNSKQGIIVGAEITNVNIPRGVNQMIVSTDSDAGFQAQLEETDNELNNFETVGGRVEVGPNRDQDLGIDGLGQMGQQMLVLGPLTPRMTRVGMWV